MRLFYSLLPLRQKWHERSSAATEFLIDETFRCVIFIVVGEVGSLLYGLYADFV